MVVEFRHTSLSADSLKLFSAARTAIARTRSSLEHELEHGPGLALAPAHDLGAIVSGRLYGFIESWGPALSFRF
jgi:hypothetical protein